VKAGGIGGEFHLPFEVAAMVVAIPINHGGSAIALMQCFPFPTAENQGRVGIFRRSEGMQVRIGAGDTHQHH